MCRDTILNMKFASFFLFSIAFLYADSAHGLKCHEGFNASILEVPLYHWSERECMANSDCFTQEIQIQLPWYQLQGSVRYGGCVSSSYSPLLSCESLFGEKSNLDPSTLFKMLPKLDGFFRGLENQFRDSVEENYRLLFSNGTADPGSFINGCFRLFSNLGLKVEKALPLRLYFVKMMEMAYPKDYQPIGEGLSTPTQPTMKDPKKFFDEFFEALRNVTEDYKLVYPNSEFPEITWKFANLINISATPPPYHRCYLLYSDMNYNSTKVDECYRKQNEAYRERNRNMYNAWMGFSIDLQFAIFNEIDFTKIHLYQEIMKAFPDYQFIVRFFRVLDRQDVKELFKGLFDWYRYPAGREYSAGFFEKLVGLSNETVARITSKLGDFNKELRKEFSPRSCKYYTCKSDNCNTQERLTEVKRVLKIHDSDKDKNEKEITHNFQGNVTPASNPATTPETTSASMSKPVTDALKVSTTTNGSDKIRSSFLFNAIAMFVLRKLF